VNIAARTVAAIVTRLRRCLAPAAASSDRNQAGPAPLDASRGGHIERLQGALARERQAARLARKEAAVLTQELEKAHAEIDQLRRRDPSDIAGEARALVEQLQELVERLRATPLVDREQGGFR
jgi:hypothetical protein